LIFVDGFGEEAFKILDDYPFVKGITTNPTILKKSKKGFIEAVKTLEKLRGIHFVQGSLQNLKWIKAIQQVKSEKFIVKLPWDCKQSSKVAKTILDLGFKFCATAVYKPSQVISAKYSGASFVAVYYSRMVVNNMDPREIIEFAMEKDLKVLVASLKTPLQVESVLKVGDVSVTLPPEVLHRFFTVRFPEDDLNTFEGDFKL